MITQFTINLNKGEDIAEREQRWRKRREIITLTVLSLVTIIVCAINYQQYKSMNGLLESKQSTIREIDRQLDSLKKTGKNISKEDVLALAKLEKERVLWTKKFLAMGELLPEDVALTHIEFKNSSLVLRFIAKIKKDEREFDQVKGLIDKLRNSSLFFRDFQEMKLKEQHQATIEEQAFLSFTVLSNIEKGVKKKRRGRRSDDS